MFQNKRQKKKVSSINHWNRRNSHVALLNWKSTHSMELTVSVQIDFVCLTWWCRTARSALRCADHDCLYLNEIEIHTPKKIITSQLKLVVVCLPFRLRRLWLVQIGSMRMIVTHLSLLSSVAAAPLSSSSSSLVRLQPTKHSQSHTQCALRSTLIIAFIDIDIQQMFR